MRVNRGLLNWGIFLVVLGAVPLAVQLNIIDAQLARDLVRLWPLILIALGVGLMLRFTPVAALGGFIVAATLGLLLGAVLAGGWGGIASGGCLGDERATGTPITQSGTFAGGGQVSMELTCAELALDSQPGNGWQVTTVVSRRVGDPQPVIESAADSLRLRTQAGDQFLGGARRDWQVTLPEAAPLAIDLTTNASSGQLDLAGSTIERLGATLNASDVRFELSGVNGTATLDLTLNASSSTLRLPAAGASGSITLNASSLTVCLDPALALDIVTSETLSSNNFAAAGLSQAGNRWTVGAAGGARFTLDYSGNVSSITLDRSGGCP